MKTLTKIALAITLFATAAASHAQWVNGYSRGNGTYVSGYNRSISPGYSAYSGYGSTRCYPTYNYSTPVSVYGSSSTYGTTTYHNYYSTGGGSLTGTTMRYGNTSYTSLYGW